MYNIEHTYDHSKARKAIISPTCDLIRKFRSWQNSKIPSLIHNISYKNNAVCFILSLIKLWYVLAKVKLDKLMLLRKRSSRDHSVQWLYLQWICNVMNFQIVDLFSSLDKQPMSTQVAVIDALEDITLDWLSRHNLSWYVYMMLLVFFCNIYLSAALSDSILIYGASPSFFSLSWPGR